MQFYISRNVIGTKKHLCVTDGEYSWTNNIPDNAWQLGDNLTIKSIHGLFKLYNREVKGFDQVPEYKFFRDLGMKPHEVQWSSVLTKERYSGIMTSIINAVQSSLEFSKSDPYINTYLKSKESLMMLEKAFVNSRLLGTKLATSVGSQHSNLQTFKPCADGFAKPVMYDQFSTATGRLIVKGGPQILTLSKDHRDIIASRWGEDGVIAYVDFVSLEPRVALMRLGIDPGKDVYEFVNDECFDGELTRAKAKISTLGALYGMSVRTFGGKSGGNRQKLKEVKSLFQVDDLSNELHGEWEDTGKIMNMFGRRIKPNEGAKHILVNSWLQSTAVDVAMVGFNNLIKDLQFSTSALPLFYIHDACVFDLKKQDIEKFCEIVENGTTITGLGKFPLTTDIIGESSES
jgi:hypothetical protein